MNIDRYIIELVGTYIYVFINLYFNDPIITGLTLATIIFLGHLFSYSGHFNPVVTLSLLLDKKVLPRDLFINYVFQFLAGFLGYKTYKIFK